MVVYLIRAENGRILADLKRYVAERRRRNTHFNTHFNKGMLSSLGGAGSDFRKAKMSASSESETTFAV